MNNRGIFALWFSFIVILAFLIWVFLFFAFYKTPGLEDNYAKLRIVNPVTGFSIEQASDFFNESFVYYFLYSTKAYNLHNAPLSDDDPKIEIVIDDVTYNAFIDRGIISVSRGKIKDKDIIIETSSKEMIIMINDNSYISYSFGSGSSKIIKVSANSILLSKGYFNLYKELTGFGITGNIIQMFSN